MTSEPWLVRAPSAQPDEESRSLRALPPPLLELPALPVLLPLAPGLDGSSMTVLESTQLPAAQV